MFSAVRHAHEICLSIVCCLLSGHVNIVQSAARKHCPLLSPSSQNSTVSCSQTSRKQVLANRNESLQFPEHAARVMRTACISECVPCTQARRGGGHVTMNYSHSAPAPASQCVLQTSTEPHRLTIVFVWDYVLVCLWFRVLRELRVLSIFRFVLAWLENREGRKGARGGEWGRDRRKKEGKKAREVGRYGTRGAERDISCTGNQGENSDLANAPVISPATSVGDKRQNFGGMA